MKVKMAKIYIGADHAGYKLKEYLKRYFDKLRIAYKDVGTYNKKSVDYPDYAFKVAKAVAKDKNSKGILICGTGTGMVMAANKIKGIRAAVAYDKYSAVMAREHNNANVLCLRGMKFSFEKAKELVKIWLKTKFSGAIRHKKRIDKISRI